MSDALRTTDDVVRYLDDVATRAARGAIPAAYGVFASAYYRVTLEVIARIPSGVFEDPGWLSEFDVAFARLYRRALDQRPEAPSCWRIAFDVADTTSPDRELLHLLLGINAHMSFDLCEVLTAGLVDDPDRRRRDFDAVNRVMGWAIDPIQRLLRARFGADVGHADALGMRLDEVLSVDRFVRWRTRAWEDAMDVRDGKTTLAEVDRRVTERGRWLARIPL